MEVFGNLVLGDLEKLKFRKELEPSDIRKGKTPEVTGDNYFSSNSRCNFAAHDHRPTACHGSPKMGIGLTLQYSQKAKKVYPVMFGFQIEPQLLLVQYEILQTEHQY